MVDFVVIVVWVFLRSMLESGTSMSVVLMCLFLVIHPNL
jgi:hypothetical protein